MDEFTASRCSPLRRTDSESRSWSKVRRDVEERVPGQSHATRSAREVHYEYEYQRSSYVEVEALAQGSPEGQLNTLIQAIGQRVAQDFFWKAETDTIQTYEHRLTSRFVHVDSTTGEFFNQQRSPISMESALSHAMPKGELPRHPLLLPPAKALELPLTAFVRRDDGAGSAETGPESAELHVKTRAAAEAPEAGRRGVLSRLYHRLSGSLSILRTPAEPSVSTERAAQEPAGGDLSLSAFTRRAA